MFFAIRKRSTEINREKLCSSTEHTFELLLLSSVAAVSNMISTTCSQRYVHRSIDRFRKNRNEETNTLATKKGSKKLAVQRRSLNEKKKKKKKHVSALDDDDDVYDVDDDKEDDDGYGGVEMNDLDYERQTEMKQPKGFDGQDVWYALGFVFDFMTPSSQECKKIIRASAEQNRVVLKNISQWRKPQWEKAAQEYVKFKNQHTPLPGCRGYRVCWQTSVQFGGDSQQGDLLLIFVPSTRKFHREEDFRKGFDCGLFGAERAIPGSSDDDFDDADEEEEEEEEEEEVVEVTVPPQKKKRGPKKTTKKKKKKILGVRSAKDILDAVEKLSRVNEHMFTIRQRIAKNGEKVDVAALAEGSSSNSWAESSYNNIKNVSDEGEEEHNNKNNTEEDVNNNNDDDNNNNDNDIDDDDDTVNDAGHEANDDDDNNVSTNEKYGSPENAWAEGQGADAPSLWLRYNINFDFHGPAGFVNRAVVKAASERKGISTSQNESWPKYQWIEAAERAGITYKSSHAAISQCGRGWKLCWVDDDVNITMKNRRNNNSDNDNGNENRADDDDERRRRRRASDGIGSSAASGTYENSANDMPQVFVWVPETAKYYTFGAALKNNQSKIAGVSVQDVAKAAVAAAKSQPPPPGLKAALLRDSDFLATLGRAASTKEEKSKKESTSTTSTTTTTTNNNNNNEEDEEDAVAETREEKILAMAREAREKSRIENNMNNNENDENDDDDLENQQRETNLPPGFDADSPNSSETFDGQPVASDFYSRSAGYLSFVRNDWSEEDTMQEMGLKQIPDYYSDEVLSSGTEVDDDELMDLKDETKKDDEEEERVPKPVTFVDYEKRDEQVAPLESPKTFPNRMALFKEQAAEEAANAPLAKRYNKDQISFWQKFPDDLPTTKKWQLIRLAGVDFLILQFEDGRLDFSEVLRVRRDEETGKCTTLLERVNTSEASKHIKEPLQYVQIHWTEQHHELKEGWDETNPDPRALSTYTREWERTTKLYLVPSNSSIANDVHATLDFKKPVVVLSNGERGTEMFKVHENISGAKENPDGLLVIKQGELTVVPQTQVPGYEELIRHWENETQWEHELDKRDFNESFYREIDFDGDIGDETPEIDLI